MGAEGVYLIDFRVHFVPVAENLPFVFTVADSASECLLGHISDNEHCIAFIADSVGKMIKNSSCLTHAVRTDDDHRSFFLVKRLRLVDTCHKCERIEAERVLV